MFVFTNVVLMDQTENNGIFDVIKYLCGISALSLCFTIMLLLAPNCNKMTFWDKFKNEWNIIW